ncbi:MAG: hypothetical protein JWM53_2508 [bacterium]|nr:hypothetical protein [bacterium]
MSSLELTIRQRIAIAVGCILLITVGCGTQSCVQSPPPGPANVLTQHNDNQRTGLNLRETVLTPATVKSGGFHKLFSYVLDGQPYAQPLYVHGLDFGGGVKRNVVFIATMHSTVYAFDADHPTLASSPIWSTNLGEPFVPPRGDTFGGCHDHPNIDPVAGITSTPAIDLNRGVIYVSAKTRKVHACAWDDQEWEYGVHALDLRTGADAIPSTSVCGAASNGHGSWIRFAPYKQLQRPGLLLDHGVLYLGFGSHCDYDPYWGWVFAFDAATLRAIGNPYVTTPGGSEGSIWQAGQGLAADDRGFVYFMTGNGEENTSATPPSLGEAFVKLVLTRIPTSTHPNIGFSVAGYHHPGNIPGDLDLGSSGPLLVAGSNLIVGGGKQGKLYLLNRDNMANAVEVFQATGNADEHHIHGAPVAFDSPIGSFLYLCPEEEKLRMYRFDKNKPYIDPEPAFTADVLCSPEMPGGFMSISAAGNLNGIVWVNHVANHLPGDDDNGDWAAGGLDALDALTLEHLWSSANNPGDSVGFFAKFSAPTIADGKVFVNSFGGAHDGGFVHVYGLRRDPACGGGQECVNGICQACTEAEIAANCANRPCDSPNGCGGKCGCKPGYHCGVDIQIDSGPHSPPGVPYMPPPPPPKVCLCDPGTAKRNCDGKCNIADGCGGLCTCNERMSCDPQTSTCCDWRIACTRATACSIVCGGVQCPCLSGSCVDGKCCTLTCSETSKCGSPNGCGGTCNGSCPPEEVCVEDTGTFYCEDTIRVCRVKPWLCGPNGPDVEATMASPVAKQKLLATCKQDPAACAVNTPHGKHIRHHGHM